MSSRFGSTIAPVMTIAALTASLSDAFGDRWLLSEGARAHYAQSEGHHSVALPDLVVKPMSIAEVQQLAVAAHAAGVPIVPMGVNTSLEGNAAAVPGGIIVDLSGMNRIVEVAAEDLLCVVEPGVTREQLNTDLRATGLFFPIDPGANATLGGMISTRASGTNAVRYGTMRDNVLALKVVLPDGTLVTTGTRARKSAAGYDLTHLFTGSEGTLGLIVEATVRLHGIPDTVLSGSWGFETLAGAVDTVIATVQSGIPVARIELLDPAAIRAFNAYAGIDLPERPTLFVELHGTAAAVAEQRQMIAALGQEYGGDTLVMSTDPDEQRRLWKARHNAQPAARAMRAGAVVWTTDICVPISRLADAIANAHHRIAAEGLTAPIVGHVGDGNFHVLFVLDPDDAAGWAAAKRVNQAMIDHALSVGGTSTGEHGIGLGKRAALVAEHGGPAVALMRAVKAAIDPDNIMNPGKIFG